MSETSESEHPSPPGILKKPRPIILSAKQDDESIGQKLLHMKPFKLRFAPRRDLGRSYVSLVKPLGIEATVTPKFHTRQWDDDTEVSLEDVERVYEKIERKFRQGPKDLYKSPVTSAHEYGWWCTDTHVSRDPRLCHHIKDSYWLKSRIAVLTADQKLK